MKAKLVLSTALCFALMLSASSLSAQTTPAAQLLEQSGNGVLTLVMFDKDKKEIGRGAAVVLSETTRSRRSTWSARRPISKRSILKEKSRRRGPPGR